jgi:hypothetical protein
MSRTWIFQSNPARFDIDGYLINSTGEIAWLVTTNAKNIGVGDTVYLWRSGKDGGIVAEAEVTKPVWFGPDIPEALPYWRKPEGGSTLAPRVTLMLRRLASRQEVLRRDWLKEDPDLQSLTIIRQPNGTNYSVTPDHAARLATLWGKAANERV